MRLAVVSDQAERYSTFVLGGEHYAVPHTCVREELRDVPIAPIPAGPRFLRGAIALNGQAVPVVDLGPRLGQAFRSSAKRMCVIVVQVHREGVPMLLGLTADTVGAAVHLNPQDVVPAPSFGSAVPMDSFISGMGRHGDGLLLLLDAERVLSSSELLAAEEFAVCADLKGSSRPSKTGLRSV